MKMARGEIDRPRALMEGLYHVEGDMNLLMKMGGLFRAPVKAKEEMMKIFPLGVFKDRLKEVEALPEPPTPVFGEKVADIMLENIPAVERSGEPDWGSTPEQYRQPQIKIAGFGGQGVLFLGALLSNVALRKNFHVTWLPAYGPESRGGFFFSR